MTSNSSLALHNTLFEAETVRQMIGREYPLTEPISCELVRRGFNDHYLITSPEGRYVFRVYFHGKYYIGSDSDFRFELDLLAYLHARGVPVSHTIPRRDGTLLCAIREGSVMRYGALFTYAEGNEGETITPERACILGKTMAQLHANADDFRTDHRRYHLNLELLVDQPLR